MRIENILFLFEKVRPMGTDKYQALCPAHADSSPSLSLRQAGDRVLVFCHAGCTFQAISDAIGVDPREWFDDHEVPAEVRPAREMKRLQRQAMRNWRSAEAMRAQDLSRELRRRDMEMISINARVFFGALTEDEALPLLGALYKGYAEMEQEWREAWKNGEMPDSEPDRTWDAWQRKVQRHIEQEGQAKL